MSHDLSDADYGRAAVIEAIRSLTSSFESLRTEMQGERKATHGIEVKLAGMIASDKSAEIIDKLDKLSARIEVLEKERERRMGVNGFLGTMLKSPFMAWAAAIAAGAYGYIQSKGGG